MWNPPHSKTLKRGALGKYFSSRFLHGVPHGMGLKQTRHPLVRPSFYVRGNPHGCFSGGDPPPFCADSTLSSGISRSIQLHCLGIPSKPLNSSFVYTDLFGSKEYLTIILLMERHAAYSVTDGRLLSSLLFSPHTNTADTVPHHGLI